MAVKHAMITRGRHFGSFAIWRTTRIRADTNNSRSERPTTAVNTFTRRRSRRRRGGQVQLEKLVKPACSDSLVELCLKFKLCLNFLSPQRTGTLPQRSCLINHGRISPFLISGRRPRVAVYPRTSHPCICILDLQLTIVQEREEIYFNYQDSAV
jgi:hypothetical protein